MVLCLYIVIITSPAASILTRKTTRSSIASLSPASSGREDPFSFCGDPRVTETVYSISPARSQGGGPFSHAFGKELICMQATPINPTRKREELKAERNLLFKRFLKNPTDTHLALRIKSIDDQVAECSELMRQKKKRRY